MSGQAQSIIAAAKAWQPLHKRLAGRDVALLAEDQFEMFLNMLRVLGAKPQAVFSRAAQWVGKQASGLKIEPFDKLGSLQAEVPLCLCVADPIPAAREACKLGQPELIEIYHSQGPLKRKYAPEPALDNLDGILEFLELLSDAQSRDCLTGIALFRLGLQPLSCRIADYPQYLHPLAGPRPGEVIIDAGAFDGDSAASFLEYLHGKAKLYCFEPDPENFRKLKRLSREHRFGRQISAERLGLWDCQAKLGLSGAASIAKLDQAGSGVDVTTLDAWRERNQVKPGFIKLDIEGAEPQALRGAAKTISQLKPRLAVSVYHEAAHLWELPLYLAKLRPEAKFFLGHHDSNTPGSETIFYLA